MTQSYYNMTKLVYDLIDNFRRIIIRLLLVSLIVKMTNDFEELNYLNYKSCAGSF